MITVEETESTLGFIRPVHFARTGKIRERVVDCSREELIDLVFRQINMLERAQGYAQHSSEMLEKELGWQETK